MQFDAMVQGIPLVFVVFGLVEFAKKMGLAGKAATVGSLVIGTAIGIGYQLTLGVPAVYAGWFSAGFYGVALGLTASGVYDFVDARAPKKESEGSG